MVEDTAAYRRLVRKLTIENLWLYVLSLLKKGPVYGYEIGERIERGFGFKPGRVTCYIVLHKLESEGLIAAKRIHQRGEKASRKYYVITAKGERALERARIFLRRLSQEL